MARRDACEGLLAGRALRLQDGELVSVDAPLVASDRLVCAACYAGAVLRRCTDKLDHFAHAGTRGSWEAPGESVLHRACKSQLCAALAIRHPGGDRAIERPIPARAEQGLAAVIPDLSGRIGEHRVAVEVQASALGLPSILQRTQVYARRGIHVSWVIPVPAPPDPVLMRPKLYERYLHSLYFGRAYYWWPGLGARVVPIHHGHARAPAAAGFAGSYKALKVPMAAPAVDISRDFVPVQRASFTPRNERKAVPACRLWFDGKEPWRPTAMPRAGAWPPASIEKGS